MREGLLELIELLPLVPTIQDMIRRLKQVEARVTYIEGDSTAQRVQVLEEELARMLQHIQHIQHGGIRQ